MFLCKRDEALWKYAMLAETGFVVAQINAAHLCEVSPQSSTARFYNHQIVFPCWVCKKICLGDWKNVPSRRSAVHHLLDAHPRGKGHKNFNSVTFFFFFFKFGGKLKKRII